MIDYYAILNIEHNATKKEIKTAFKKEALKWHPDRNSSPEATARMQLINAGLKQHNIEIADQCTLCSPNYFSNRRACREGNRQTGRCATVIGFQ